MPLSLSGYLQGVRALIHTHFFYPYCLLGDHFLETGNTLVCDDCLQALATTGEDHKPYHWTPENQLLQQVFSYWEFSDSFRQLIHHIKYQHKPNLGDLLGRYIAHFIPKDWIYRTVYLIPVPLHRAKRRERGYNQAEFIAKGIGYTTHVPVLTNALVRTRYTRTQTRLSREQRKQNMHNAFVLSVSEQLVEKMTESTILLVDDIFTTGATLESAGTTIHRATGARVYGITLGTVPLNAS